MPMAIGVHVQQMTLYLTLRQTVVLDGVGKTIIFAQFLTHGPIQPRFVLHLQQLKV